MCQDPKPPPSKLGKLLASAAYHVVRPGPVLLIMAAVAPSRLAALTRLRCEIFQTAYNPTSVRTGAKYLRARLRGPSMISYYPKQLTVAHFNRMSGNFRVQDWDEYQRLADVEEKKRRGKGVPKKAKSPGACC